MRLKTYTAASMAEAMSLVRKDMGLEAIIVATHQDTPGASVQVTAALETPDRDDEAFTGWGVDGADQNSRSDGDSERSVVRSSGRLGELRRDLGYHGVPADLAERLARLGVSFATDDPALALAGALDEVFAFSPLPDRPPAKPIMLVGPPGAGKTIVTAKLMMRARRAERPLAGITTDTRRAGGVEQLQAFTAILGADLTPADAPAVLAAALRAAGGKEVYIDTAGVNPYDDDELEALRELVRAARAEPVLVLPAGGDPMEAADIARALASVGARRMIATRLDMTRRFGGLLAAAAAGQMAFADVGISPFVADGLAAINPVSLARLLAPVPAGSAEKTAEKTAAAPARLLAKEAAQ